MLPKTLTDLHGLNAVAFIRVSTDKQNMSPDTQKRTIERFAATHGLNIVQTIELTISGKDAWRDPAVTQITEAAERGEVRAVIVSMLDRMGRSPRTDLFIDDLTAANAVLIDAGSEMISSNAAHRRSMRTGIAQAGNERDLIRERVSNGITDRNRTHHDQWGHPPAGFTRTGGSPSLLQIDTTTIGDVIALFERYAEGTTSIATLARETGRNENTLKDILANRIYNGWVQNEGTWTEAPWRDSPPVSDHLYDRVQRVRARRTRAGGPRPANRVNLFEGLLYCAYCDARLVHDGFAGTTTRYQRIRHKNPCQEWGREERHQVMRWVEPLTEQIAQVQIDDHTTTQIVSHLRSGTPANVTPMRFKQDREKVFRDLVARKITAAQAEERVTAIDAAEETHKAEAPAPTATAEQITAALTDLRRTWIVADDRTKAQVINAMYEKVRLGTDGTFPEDAVTLTADAEAIGLALAMPEEFGMPERTGTTRPTKIARIPIRGRSDWLKAAQVAS